MNFKSIISILIIMSNMLFCKTIAPPIIPAPKIASELKGDFQLPENVKIILTGENAENNRFAAQNIAATLKSSCKISAGITTGLIENTSIVLQQYTPSSSSDLKPYEMNADGYLLRISEDGIIIKSTSSKGIFYGAMSLIQLIEKSAKLSCAEIEDWPDMKVRGISDDISRGQVSTLENFKKIISFMARYKMNTYMPYIEDMLQLDSYPSIGRNRGALSKSEVRELVAYAKIYYIDILPVFQTLGHFENILIQKEFQKYAEFPGAASLNVSFDSTYVFLENMLREVTDLFPSEYINIGADESHDVGLGKSRALVEESNIAQVHLDHYLKVYDIVKKLGKKAFMYGDIILNHPEILKGLPKDIIVVDWHYRPEYDYPSTRTFRDAGHNYYVSPSVWNFQTTFPTNINALPNIKYIIKAGLNNGSTGMINSNWGDYGAETFKELIYMGYAYSAACSWNYKMTDEGSFKKMFLADYFGADIPEMFDIFENLSNPVNQVLWHDLWRHPALPFREAAWWDAKIYPVTKANSMEAALPHIKAELLKAESQVKKNSDQFEILKFIIDLGMFYKDKIYTQYLIQEQMAGRKGERVELDKKIETQVSGLDQLKTRFKKIWCQYYKPENLELVEGKFDRLTGYYNEIKRDLTDGSLRSAEIQSKWIYCPGKDSGLVKSAEFKKTFELESMPEEALVQLIGDTYARVYVNGKYAGEVSARRTLSLIVELERVKMFDISSMLKTGKNTITVETENYNKKGAAGINLIAHFESKGNVTEIFSDRSWIASELKEGENDKKLWQVPIEKNYPFVISAPDFPTMRKSWIER